MLTFIISMGVFFPHQIKDIKLILVLQMIGKKKKYIFFYKVIALISYKNVQYDNELTNTYTKAKR